MSFSKKAVIGLILTISGVLAGPGAFAEERVEEYSFDVNPDARLTVDTHRGEVNIRTANVNRIEITATITGSEDELERAIIDVSGSENRVYLDQKHEFVDQRWFWSGGDSTFAEVTLDVVIPETIDLIIDSHRSELIVQAPSGRLRIDDHRGRGEITGIRSNISLDSHRGNFDLEIVELHDLDIKTHRGDIYATIEKADDFRIRADTHRSDLHFRGRDIPVSRDDRESDVDVEFGEGTHRIDIDAHRGDIDLAFK